MNDPRRYLPAVAIGGGIAGVALAVPVVGDLLRCLFSVGVMAGAALSMKLWLDKHLAENLTRADAAVLGACSGGVTAAVAWLLALPVQLAFGDTLVAFYKSGTLLPDLVRHNLETLYEPRLGVILLSLPVQLLVHGTMGALGGTLALQLAFPTRRDDA